MKKALQLLCFTIVCYFQSSAQTPCTLPNNFFPDDTIVVCYDTITNLTATNIPGANYSWSNGEDAVSFITVTRDGQYWVTVSDANCTVTDTVTVLFNSFLLSPEVYDRKLCLNTGSVTLSATGQNLNWYMAPIGGMGQTQPFTATTTQLGVDSFWVSQTIRGCESPRALIQVEVITKPNFELGPDFIIPCGIPGIVLTVEQEEETDYLWSNGSTDISILAEGRGVYHLFAQNMCGTHRDTVQAIQCEDKCVQFPTAFSPNGDGLNETYRAFVSCPLNQFRMIIYNQSGIKMFETRDPTVGWNGTFNGKPQNVGVYVYYSEYFDFKFRRTVALKGTILLIR